MVAFALVSGWQCRWRWHCQEQQTQAQRTLRNRQQIFHIFFSGSLHVLYMQKFAQRFKIEVFNGL